MKYYRIGGKGKYFSSKKTYAYLSVNKDNEINDVDKEPKIKHLMFKCPYCGRKVIYIYYTNKNIAVFNKDKVGDFSFGVTCYGSFVATEKLLNMFEKYNLTGIVDYIEYKYAETVKRKPITSYAGKLYDVKITYLPIIWEHCENLESDEGDKKTLVFESELSGGCIHCCGKKGYIGLAPKAKVYLENLNKVNIDIFSTMDNPTAIFVSERLVEACEKEGITNILDKLVRVYDDSEYKGEDK